MTARTVRTRDEGLRRSLAATRVLWVLLIVTAAVRLVADLADRDGAGCFMDGAWALVGVLGIANDAVHDP